MVSAGRWYAAIKVGVDTLYARIDFSQTEGVDISSISFSGNHWNIISVQDNVLIIENNDPGNNWAVSLTQKRRVNMNPSSGGQLALQTLDETPPTCIGMNTI